MEKHKQTTAAKKSSNRHRGGHSETELTPEQYIAGKKQEAVQAVMVVFNKWLDKRLSVISYAYETSGGTDGSSGGSANEMSGSRGGNSGSSSGNGGPKRQLSNGNFQGRSTGGDGNGGGQDRTSNKRARKDAEEKPLFACHFFQHDPSKHCAHRSCTGPGWPTIHRLKEHLNRNHRLKHICARCQTPWPDAEALSNHLRSDIPCSKSDVVRVQGIDDAQEKKLKERRKTSGSLTEEQKWRDIYMVLFPNSNRNAMPSPCTLAVRQANYHADLLKLDYDSKDSVTYAKSAAQWKKMKKHIQKELPQAVQKRVQQRFEGVKVELLDSLSDIVRDEIFHIFKGFPQAASAPASPCPVSRSATPKLASPSPIADESKALNLDSYLKDQDAPLNLFSGFNDLDFDQQFDFNAECLSDSGYASNSTMTAPACDSFKWP